MIQWNLKNGFEEWRKFFTVTEVPGDKRMNIRTFYLTNETDIWWNIVKNRLLGLV